jgi:uncharacterized protein Yka (UPF0111/DUF47 family)
MSIPDWATTVSGVLALLAAFSVVGRILIRHLVHDYLSELKPNGGSSMKDKVTNIESKVNRLENRIDQIYILLVTEKK